MGDMVVARDPLGFQPLCYAKEGPLFAAASESVPLLNLGFQPRTSSRSRPGTRSRSPTASSRSSGSPTARGRRTASSSGSTSPTSPARSTSRSVYLSRTALGEELARLEDRWPRAARRRHDRRAGARHRQGRGRRDGLQARACRRVEGLIRNRYVGRTFIEGRQPRRRKAETKYTPLREVLEGKRVLLVEDSIVRSTTMQVLLHRIRERGGAKEIHVRVACPPIVAPCFYGIDMSTVDELFAPKFLQGGPLTEEVQAEMADALGADSLRYLPVESIARAINLPSQPALPGLHHRPLSDAARAEALPNRAGTTSARPTAAGRTYEVQHELTFAR